MTDFYAPKHALLPGDVLSFEHVNLFGQRTDDARAALSFEHEVGRGATEHAFPAYPLAVAIWNFVTDKDRAEQERAPTLMRGAWRREPVWDRWTIRGGVRGRILGARCRAAATHDSFKLGALVKIDFDEQFIEASFPEHQFPSDFAAAILIVYGDR